MPAPPIPTNQSRRPSSGSRKGDQLLGDLVGRVRARGAKHCLSHPRQPRGVGEQLADEARHALQLRLRDDDGAAAPLEVARVLRLVIGGRVRIRDEHRRLARRGQLPDRAAGARDDEVGGRERGAEVVGVREQPVVVAVNALSQRLVVALAAEVEHGRARPRPTPRPPARSAQRALAAAEDEQHRPGAGSSKRRAVPPRVARRASAPGSAARRRGTSARCASIGIGQEDAPRERRREPVREPEVRVGLRQRRRESAAARPRAPSAPRRSRRRRARRPAGARARIRPQARGGAAPPASSAREQRDRGRRGSPEIRNVSSSKPASGTSRASTRSGDPAKVTVHAARAQRFRHRQRRQRRARPSRRLRSGT